MLVRNLKLVAVLWDRLAERHVVLVQRRALSRMVVQRSQPDRESDDKPKHERPEPPRGKDENLVPGRANIRGHDWCVLHQVDAANGHR
jgi:hypothetical protein